MLIFIKYINLITLTRVYVACVIIIHYSDLPFAQTAVKTLDEYFYTFFN